MTSNTNMAKKAKAEKKDDHLRIALGTVQLGIDYGINNREGKPSAAKALEILKIAYESGVRMFDTAALYGDSEKIIGEFISADHLENDIAIITKIGHVESGKEEMEEMEAMKVKEAVITTVKKSLERLKLKHVEGLLLHDAKQMYDDKVLAAMESAKQSRLTKKIGVSVYDEEDAINAVKSGRFQCVQLPYNIFDHGIDETDFFKLAKKNNITVIARSPFLQGLFLMKQDDIPAHLEKAKPYLAALDKIIKKYGLSRQEAALLFAYSNPDIDYVLFGVDDKDQLEQNISIIKNKSMSDECLSELRKSFNGIAREITNPSLWKIQNNEKAS
jgi:aryl-alcohol dehydrogenase-like predicted oxidoreductase